MRITTHLIYSLYSLFLWPCFVYFLTLALSLALISQLLLVSTTVSQTTPCKSCKYVLLEMVGMPLADVRAVGDKLEWVDESDSWGVTVSPDVHWVLTLGQTWATLVTPPSCTLDAFGIHSNFFFLCRMRGGMDGKRSELNSLGRDLHGLTHCRLKWWTVVSWFTLITCVVLRDWDALFK